MIQPGIGGQQEERKDCGTKKIGGFLSINTYETETILEEEEGGGGEGEGGGGEEEEEGGGGEEEEEEDGSSIR
jgi:hypothetical protein